MKTTQETIKRTVYVYAEALTDYQIERLDPGELPFNYEVRAFDYGDERSVRIMEHELLVPIPEGIDITMECIKNLEEKMDAIRKEADEEIEKLQNRIRALALIEYRPDPDVTIDASAGPDFGDGPHGSTDDDELA